MMSSIPNPNEINDNEIARIGMIAELDAINLYIQLASNVRDRTLRETLLDIANEEIVHFGEFMTFTLNSDRKYIEDGINEVCNRAIKMGLEIESCKDRLIR